MNLDNLQQVVVNLCLVMQIIDLIQRKLHIITIKMVRTKIQPLKVVKVTATYDSSERIACITDTLTKSLLCIQLVVQIAL